MSELKVWFERGKNLVFSATGFFPVSNLGSAYNYNIHLDESNVLSMVSDIAFQLYSLHPLQPGPRVPTG